MTDEAKEPTQEVRNPESEQPQGLAIKTIPESPTQEAAAPIEPAATQDTDTSRHLRETGEDRKALLDTMFRDAEASEMSKEALLKLLEERPTLASVAEKKFSDRLAVLKGAEPKTELSREDLKMQAKAELYLELERKEKTEMTFDIAEKLSMSQEEADRLQKLAESYAKEASVDFKTALVRMAMAEKPQHAAALSMPVGSSVSSGSAEFIQISADDKSLAQRLGRDPKWVAEQRKRVEDSLEQGQPIKLMA